MRAIIILIIAATAVVVLAAGCGSASASDGRTDVAAAFYPLAFAAQEIGGPTVDVTNLTPPGAEPHDVELSVRDVERVRTADVVLYLGGGFQPAVERAVEGADGEAIDLLASLPSADARLDPHVWLDPVLYADLAEQIATALDAADTPRRDAFVERLSELHLGYKNGLALCERREIVTSHDAFGYLADRYDLEQIPITGLSPEAEPAPRELEHVVAEVRARGAPTVFVETLVSPELAETVARETGADVATLDPLEGLSEDAAAHGATYFSVMRKNLATLRTALECR